MNDVKSNEMVLASELELLEGAVLKFRDPGAGDSEEEDEEIREGFMMSVSVEKDELSGKEPSKSSFWRVESSNGKSRCRMVEEKREEQPQGCSQAPMCVLFFSLFVYMCKKKISVWKMKEREEKKKKGSQGKSGTS